MPSNRRFYPTHIPESGAISLQSKASFVSSWQLAFLINGTQFLDRQIVPVDMKRLQPVYVGLGLVQHTHAIHDDPRHPRFFNADRHSGFTGCLVDQAACQGPPFTLMLIEELVP